ncbi:MAG: hypothetical protein LBV50_11650, partial [Novosphingobium sp.]|nr:hypothetical protein [Novosphingobium sp.]
FVAVLVYFFLDGLQYPSSGGPYFSIWLPLLGMLIAILAGAGILHNKGKHTMATVLLALLAAPPVLYIAFFGLLIATVDRWN